jgi:hypothetical protein
MCTLGDVLAQTVKGNFQYVIDLEAAYHHLRIHPDSYKFLGFCIMIDGCEVFFVYLVLVFGLKTAGQLLGRVLKPVLTFLAEGGVCLLVYIDDGRGSASSKDLADKPYALVRCGLASAGFTILLEKSEGPGESSRVKEYLGLILYTEQMRVTVPDHKYIWIKRDLGIFLEKSPHSCRVVASIVGRLNSLVAALGTEVYVSTRMSTNEFVAALDQWGWDSDIFLSDDAVLGLVWLLGALDELNGHPICAPHTCISLASVLPRYSEISLDRKIPAGRYQSLMATLASNASDTDTAVAAFCIDGLPQFEMVSELSAEERTYSSSKRELIAFSRVLTLHGELLSSKGPVTIWWLTDNSNVAKFLSKGRGVRKIMIQILDIFLLSRKLGLDICPIWVQRDSPFLVHADGLSKSEDTDGWSV